MNGKLKIVDEHGIDREASVMCKVDVDGTDYAIYSIKRDDDNDNLFVSKLIMNNDGTSNMVNIDDAAEKDKLASVVKELVTYSINNDADKTTGTVTLSSGKEVKISNVLFNKEQNINVTKTYVTTVKRAVTKVGENFYKVEVPKAEPVVESVFDTPAQGNVFEPVVEAKVEPAPEPAPAVVEPVLPEIPQPEVAAPVTEAPLTTEPVAPAPVQSEPVAQPTPAPVPSPAPAVEPILPVSEPVAQQPVQPAAVEPVLPETPAPVAEAPKPDQFIVPPVEVTEPAPVPVSEPAAVTSAPAQMVFDGSKETNLNVALGEITKENTIPVENVAPIREFGQDEPVVHQPTASVETPQQQVQTGPTLVRKAGFANNKFFMVIAIAFFLASCVFLGYEVFKYFKLVG